MTKEVFITICGLQAGPDTDGEPIEMITTGEYFYKNNKHYIIYEEAIEGETGINKNRIKLSPGKMELTKSGMVSVHMLFEENCKNITHYYTPYGTLNMGIDTKKIQVEESENEMRITVDYALEMNQEFVADCSISIQVRSKEVGVSFQACVNHSAD